MISFKSVRNLIAPKPLDLSGLGGYQQLGKKLEFVKYTGGAQGRMDGFGVGGRVAGGLTVNGGRVSNEDGLLLALSLKLMQKRLLIAVADGMGGYGNGEVASAHTLDTLAAHFCERPRKFSFVDAIDRAAAMLAGWKAADPGVDQGAGTTLVSGLINLANDTLRLTHLGDARAYLFRRGGLMMLTKDDNNMSVFLPTAFAEGYALQTIQAFRAHLRSHDLSAAYEKIVPPFDPKLSEILFQLGVDYFDAPVRPPFCDATTGRPFFNSIIIKALGVDNCRGVDASSLTLKLQAGDILLLSSDGVHDFCGYHALAAALAVHQNKSPLEIAERVYGILQNLIDNVTIAVYKHG